MRLFSFLFITLFLFPLTLLAGDGDYAFSKINVSLLKNAHVVVRAGVQRYEVISFTKARLYETKAITIIDEQGDEFALLSVYYDKLRSIKSITGKLYDVNGKAIRSLKNKDIEDQSATSNISLVEDTRVKSHNFYCKTYPYTVEYDVIIEFNNTLMFPRWFPQLSEKIAVERSSFIVECPSWFTFRYKTFNYTGEPVLKELAEKKTFIWQVENLAAIEREYASPDFPYLTTCIYFSPDKFEVEGYKGTMNTWQELGQFQLRLNAGRDKLPDHVKQKVHELTDALTDTKEKVKVLYEYLQANTRYVSIQLGIGGFQPFDATYVSSKAYGDCKALSNYMYALLKEAKIRSCYTEIRAGEGRYFFLPDFPSEQFNHIIVCVPLQNDTMWLECTSQTLPAGYLGSFTSNRYALAVDDNGGKLVRTPAYHVNENLQSRNIKAVLLDDGTLNIRSNTRYSGLQQDDIHSLITNVSKDRVKDYLHEVYDFATYSVNNFDYKENKSSLPSIDESLDITVSNYATITGKRLFVLPNIMTRTSRKLVPDDARKYDLEFTLEYKDVDSVEIEIPKGYQPEAMPQDVSVETKFGKYNCSVKLVGDKLFYYRSIERYSGRFPAKDYNELVKFYEIIYKTDRNRVVLVK